jgi:hypothetical protein
MPDEPTRGPALAPLRRDDAESAAATKKWRREDGGSWSPASRRSPAGCRRRQAEGPPGRSRKSCRLQARPIHQRPVHVGRRDRRARSRRLHRTARRQRVVRPVLAMSPTSPPHSRCTAALIASSGSAGAARPTGFVARTAARRANPSGRAAICAATTPPPAASRLAPSLRRRRRGSDDRRGRLARTTASVSRGPPGVRSADDD